MNSFVYIMYEVTIVYFFHMTFRCQFGTLPHTNISIILFSLSPPKSKAVENKT